jgi:hypothetical protein
MIRFPRDHDAVSTPLFFRIRDWPVQVHSTLWVVHTPGTCFPAGQLPTLGQLPAPTDKVTLSGCPVCGAVRRLVAADRVVQENRGYIAEELGEGDEPDPEDSYASRRLRLRLDPAWAAVSEAGQLMDRLPGVDALRQLDDQWHEAVVEWINHRAAAALASHPGLARPKAVARTYLVASCDIVRHPGRECELQRYTPLGSGGHRDGLIAFKVPRYVADDVISAARTTSYRGKPAGWATTVPEATGRALTENSAWPAVLGACVSSESNPDFTQLLEAAIHAVLV